MSAKSGWYPDPGGGQGLYRYWDGNAWSAATSPNPAAPPPVTSLGSAPPSNPEQPAGVQPYGQTASYSTAGGSSPGGYGSAYADYQATQRSRKTPWGWWLGAAALLVVIVVVAAFVIRGLNNGGLTSSTPSGTGSQTVCPTPVDETASPLSRPADGRVHGGPLSYPQLGSPWSAPKGDTRVPFGSDVASQDVMVEQFYQPNQSWVASILVGELQAGDGFYTPEQGAQIVVKCILGAFYGDNEVRSSVKVNRAATVDGHEAWIVESQLSFDIQNLKTKGELLLVAIVATGSTAGLYYASIPNTVPELVAPARAALKNLKVDG